jgi:Putative auto-transporter adhesin, head GIN domain
LKKGLKMKKTIALGLVGVAMMAGAGIFGIASAQGVETNGARLLEFDGLAGQIEVRTSPGAAFNVEIIPGRKMTATLERDGTTLRVKGPLSTNIRSNCNNWGQGNRGVMTINGTRYEEGDLPRIVVTGPDSMGLRIKRSLLQGQIGNVGGATIGHASCGDLALGNVARDLEASVTASGNFRAGNVGGKAEANLAGSGDVQLGSIGGDLELNAAGSGDTQIGSVGGKADINVAGSGDVDVASVSRQAEVNIAGSGDVNLRAGRSELSANIAGSGNVRHGGTVINPEVNIVGSGDVIVARLEGQPRVSRLGSGDFRVN